MMSGQAPYPPPAGRSNAEYPPNTVIQQYIRAAKEKIEREKAEAAQRSPNFSYPSAPQAPAPAALPRAQHPAARPQWQARSASHGTPLMSSDYGEYVTDQGRPPYPAQQPVQQYPAQHSAQYGSRPVHRRTASSNYPGAAFQTIPEDRESRALSSIYAASSQAPSSHMQHGSQDMDSESDMQDVEQGIPGRGLVREASVGRTHRPTLTQIGTSESWSRRNSRQSSELARPQGGVAPVEGPDQPPPVPSLTVTPNVLRRVSADEADMSFASGTGYISPSASSFSEEITKHESPVSVRHLMRPSPGSRPNVTEQIEARQSSRPFTADSTNSSSSFRFERGGDSKSKLSERVGSKKPGPLNLEKVKQAEERGSLTSLPDLIKRALRLASNLEVGRTASRFGTDWMFESDGEKTGRKRSSTADMVNSFPGTPRSGSPRRRGQYSTMPRSAGLQSALSKSFTPNVDQAADESDEKHAHRKRCLGMPMWLFLLILLIVILLIVAAVLIPIGLIVIPNSHHDNNCVTAPVGSTSKAQVGTTIPDLINNANSSFGLQLDGDVLLSLFTNSKMTCTSENALVTFNSLTKRSHPHQPHHYVHLADASGSTTSLLAPTATPAIHDAHHHVLVPRQQSQSAATLNGIIFAMSSAASSEAPAATVTSTATVTGTGSATSTGAIATATGQGGTGTAFNPNVQNLDFARTAILYIFQQSEQLSTAQTAQGMLQTFFSNPAGQGGTTGAKNVNVGNGWTVDLVKGVVVEPTGEKVGGYASSIS